MATASHLKCILQLVTMQGCQKFGWRLVFMHLQVWDYIPALREIRVCVIWSRGISQVNEARYRLFKLGNFSDENLPPNKDCLYHHIRRSNYQTLIWKTSFDAVINAPDPAEHGWVIDNGEIELK